MGYTYLIVIRINLFHRHFGFIDVLGTFKFQYPDRTLRQVNYYEQHVDNREDDE